MVILAKVTDGEKQAVISVTNKGLGIPEEEMHKLFTCFYLVSRPEFKIVSVAQVWDCPLSNLC